MKCEPAYSPLPGFSFLVQRTSPWVLRLSEQRMVRCCLYAPALEPVLASHVGAPTYNKSFRDDCLDKFLCKSRERQHQLLLVKGHAASNLCYLNTFCQQSNSAESDCGMPLWTTSPIAVT